MENDFTDVKLEIFIPLEYVDDLREALAGAGAGEIGRYDHCLSWSVVQGSWRPLPGSDPYDGQVGQLTTGSEAKVEVNCRRDRVAAALSAVRRVHPYEEPVINVFPLANHLFS